MLQRALVVVFTDKGDGLSAGCLEGVVVERLRASALVTYA